MPGYAARVARIARKDRAKGLLMRQPQCRGFEREPGADDDLGDDEHEHGL